MTPENITLQGFKDFVKTKSGPYPYIHPINCAFGQYLTSLGYTYVSVGGTEYSVEGTEVLPGITIPFTRCNFDDLHEDLAYTIAPYYGATFEALSARLEALK